MAAHFDGMLDEIRLSKIGRNSSWLTTEYNNQVDPSTFYSVGVEEFPIPDEPVVSGEYPTNSSTGVELNPTLSIDVVDHQGDTVTVYFMSNASGSWSQIGTEQSGGNDTYTQGTSNMNSYLTDYWWSVNVSDSSNHWTNYTYSFVTGLPPVFDPFSTGWL